MQHELHSVQALRAHGASVLYDFEYDFSEQRNRIPGFVRPTPPSSLLSNLWGKHSFGNVVYLQLDISSAQADMIENIDFSALPNLQHLHLSGCGVGSKIIPKLLTIDSLKSLDLVNTSFSPQDIVKLQSMLRYCNVVVTPMSVE